MVGIAGVDDVFLFNWLAINSEGVLFSGDYWTLPYGRGSAGRQYGGLNT